MSVERGRTEQCPQCKGAGTITVTGVEITTKGRKAMAPVIMKCLTCKGFKKISMAALQQYQKETALWCDCGSPESYLVPDTLTCKHHWKCRECNKITQIG